MNRALRVEPLEDRRVLAPLAVSNTTDVVNGDTSSLSALNLADGGDGISLREAILAANATPGPSDVTFENLGPNPVIRLTQGELVVSNDLYLVNGFAELVTIDAGGASRVFNITDTSGDHTLIGLRITGGLTTGDNAVLSDNTHSGGGVRSNAFGTLTLSRTEVIGNRTLGELAQGGGVYTRGSLVAADARLIGNRAEGLASSGGGAYAGSSVQLAATTIDANLAAGQGGGVRTTGDFEAQSSTISNNRSGSFGGGVLAASIYVSQSTVSGNRSVTAGGGLRSQNVGGSVEIVQSTITANHVEGGIGGGASSVGPISIVGSVVAGNTAANGLAGDLQASAPITVRHSLVGTNVSTSLIESQSHDADGNLIGGLVGGAIDPLLTPLGAGGFHNALPGSPVLDGIPDASTHASHAFEFATASGYADAFNPGGAFTPDITPQGGGLTPDGYVFGPNEGLVLSAPSLYAGSHYTIEMLFSFDILDGYQKIIDFAGLTSDLGLYAQGNNLRFYTDAFSASTDFTAGELTHVVLSRDAFTDEVIGYVAGAEVFRFFDSTGQAVITAPDFALHFFQDDNATGGAEAGSGLVERVRVFQGPLTPEEVFSLANPPIPELPAADQVGNLRLRGGAIDYGAVEAIGIPAGFPPGDFNGDGIADAADYTVWRDTFGSTTDLRADANGNEEIDNEDRAIWADLYGNTFPDYIAHLPRFFPIVDPATAPAELLSDFSPTTAPSFADEAASTKPTAGPSIVAATDEAVLLLQLGDSHRAEGEQDDPEVTVPRDEPDAPVIDAALGEDLSVSWRQA